MYKSVVPLAVLLFLTLFTGVSYTEDKISSDNLIQQSPSHIQSAPSDSSDEYAFAQWVVQNELDPLDAKRLEIERLYKTYGFNKAVEGSLQFFSKKIKENFNTVLSRSGRYISVMADIFKEKDLPQELIFLPIIESGFNMYAYSPRRAAGLWQFIAGTAKKYGLKIDWWVDERRDPIKATVAAAEYLSDLYNMFGSWSLALAAYNAGEGRIMRALNKTKADDFWALRNTKYIKKETKNYVPFYIAASAIAIHPEGFGFENVSYHEPIAYDEVVIDSPMDIEVIARYGEVDVKEVRDLNPELRRWATPPNVPSYTVRLPVGTKERFLNNLSKASNEKKFSVEHYTVKKGDTLQRIARRLGIPQEAIIKLNSFNKNPKLKAGLTILVPPRKFTHLTKDTKKIKGKKVYNKKRKPPLITSTETKKEAS